MNIFVFTPDHHATPKKLNEASRSVQWTITDISKKEQEQQQQ